MEYVAVSLNSGGGVVRHAETCEVMNKQLGEFGSVEQAIEEACHVFKCKHVMNGVIVRGNNTGGYMVVTTQELGEV